MARFIDIENNIEHTPGNVYMVNLHLVDNDSGSIRIELTRDNATIQIRTRAEACIRAREATLTTSDTGHTSERVVQIQLGRNSELDTGCIRIADPAGTSVAQIECETEEWHTLWRTMLNVLLAHREKTDAVKLAAPVLTDPETIRTRVLQCIAESRANDGAEVDCLNVRLEDAATTLKTDQITTEGGCFLGTGIYDLDIVNGDRIDARLRLRR